MYLTDVVRSRLSVASLVSPNLVVTIEVVNALLAAFQQYGSSPLADHDFDVDPHHRKFKTLHKVEADVVSGYKTIISGIIHINENHWTYFVLDFSNQVIGYGDAFANPMPSEVEGALLWWIDRLLILGAADGDKNPIKRGKDWSFQILPLAGHDPLLFQLLCS